MEKLTRRRYTLEYKQEAVRLVSSGQRVAAVAWQGVQNHSEAKVYVLMTFCNPSNIPARDVVANGPPLNIETVAHIVMEGDCDFAFQASIFLICCNLQGGRG